MGSSILDGVLKHGGWRVASLQPVCQSLGQPAGVLDRIRWASWIARLDRSVSESIAELVPAFSLHYTVHVCVGALRLLRLLPPSLFFFLSFHSFLSGGLDNLWPRER